MTGPPTTPCAEWTGLLHALLDGELDAANAARCEAHAAACPACAAELAEQRGLRAVLAREGVAWRAPEPLRERVRAAIARERAAGRAAAVPARASRGWAGRLRAAAPWAGLPAGFAMAAGLALAVLTTRPEPGADLPGQLIAGHVRSLLADHLTDVRTSDQHTVKPWFSGRIDFSPPAVDLADRGFPLVGGRLDYIDGRVVAALIYARRKHVINLFVWPAEARRPSAGSRDGYTVLGWQQAGLAFWAVSDLNPVELKEFQDDFSERAPR